MSQSRKSRRNQGKSKKNFYKKQQLEAQSKKRKQARRKEKLIYVFRNGIDFIKEHIYFEWKKKNIIGFSLLFLVMLGLFICQCKNWKYEDVHSEVPIRGEKVVGPIYSSTHLRQYFALDHYTAKLKAIDILFATYADTAETDGIWFRLYDSNNKPIFSRKILREELGDNTYFRVTFPEKISCGTDTYSYTIEGTDIILKGKKDKKGEPEPPTVWMSKYEGPSQMLVVNGKGKTAKINTRYIYERKPDTIFPMLMIQLIVAFGLFFVRIRHGNGNAARNTISALVLLLNVFVLEWIVQCIGEPGIVMSIPLRILTYVLILGLTLVIFGITGNSFVSIISVDFIILLYGIANFFVMKYRGYPIVPSDLMAVGTLKTVVSNYEIILSLLQLEAILWMALFGAICFRLKSKKLLLSLKGQRKKKVSIIVSVVCFVIGLAGVGISCNSNILKSAGITVSHWTREKNYYNNGPLLNFTAHIQYAFINEPEGYSDKRAEEILEEYHQEEMTADGEQPTEAKPNIIMIMNESLADYSLWENSEVKTNKDPLPFLHSLTEDTIKGKCYVSIFGAGTANSELEALTGHSMAFFPTGSVVYQLFPQKTTKGMAWDLKEEDYACIAMHPQSAGNWNRENVYPSMGFDKFLSIEDFEEPEMVRYVSDKATYEEIVRLYEDRDKEKPLFVFDVTMQGHGGYIHRNKWDTSIKVKDEKFPQAEEYLSSTYVSDQAFQYLVEYFEKQEEPTVICMFGDHQPSFSDGFYKKYLDETTDIAGIQQKFITPYVVWANYDIEEETKDISSNQLSSLVKKVAGVSFSDYDRFLQDFHEEIPLINANGFQDNEGQWYSFEQKTPYDEWIEKYKILQYYMYCRAKVHK